MRRPPLAGPRTGGQTCCSLAFPCAHADPIPPVSEASNMQIVGHSNLNGVGKGGEGLALRQYGNGQRVLFLAHGRRQCASA